jgi:hypothetical protein
VREVRDLVEGKGIVTMPETHPVQTPGSPRSGAKLRTEVTLRAYEVYAAVHGKQDALVTGWCRGGMSTGELIAFLYARSFPREEWRRRVDEAFEGMVHL